MNEETADQAQIRQNDALEKEKGKADHLQPWQFKPGQSGNPSGRKAGKSLKEYAKEMLAAMTDEERQEYLKGLPKQEIWKMAEGNPPQKNETEHTGNITINRISFDDYDSPQPETK